MDALGVGVLDQLAADYLGHRLVFHHWQYPKSQKIRPLLYPGRQSGFVIGFANKESLPAVHTMPTASHGDTRRRRRTGFGEAGLSNIT